MMHGQKNIKLSKVRLLVLWMKSLITQCTSVQLTVFDKIATNLIGRIM